jgi:tetratricopeptide (TPR) repeat protein
VLQAIGVAYKRMGQPADALKQYQESLAIKREIQDKRGMAASLSEIAQIQEQSGNPQEAEKSLNQALAFQREVGDKSGTSLTLINLGVLKKDEVNVVVHGHARFPIHAGTEHLVQERQRRVDRRDVVHVGLEAELRKEGKSDLRALTSSAHRLTSRVISSARPWASLLSCVCTPSKAVCISLYISGVIFFFCESSPSA